MSRSYRVLAALAALAAMAGCGRPTDTVCQPILNAAILLTVVDSVSGLPPTVTPTVETTSQGAVVPIEGVWGNEYTMGFGRSGTFAIAVKTPGYADWSASGIIVAENSCGNPMTVHLVAKLQR
jgi:hypothetical protein